MKPYRPMTPRHRLFVAEYLVDLNGKEAAIRAGYGAAGAAVRAAKILARPEVAAALAEAMAARGGRTGITASLVIAEYAKIAFFDMRRVARMRGRALLMLPLSKVPGDCSAAIGMVEEVRVKDRLRTHVVPFDKLGALRSLGRILGVFGGKGIDPERLAAMEAKPVRPRAVSLPAASAQQRRFAAEYLIDFNGGNAARRAGYAWDSAPYEATHLLRYPGVAARVEAGMTKRLADPMSRADRAIEEYAAIAFADISRVASWTDRSVVPRSRRTLRVADAAAIELLEAEAGTPKRIRLHDKQYALDRLALHLGILDRVVPGGRANRLYPEQKAARLLRARLKALGI